MTAKQKVYGRATCTAQELITVLQTLPPDLAITANWEGQIVPVEIELSGIVAAKPNCPESYCLSVENL